MLISTYEYFGIKLVLLYIVYSLIKHRLAKRIHKKVQQVNIQEVSNYKLELRMLEQDLLDHDKQVGLIKQEIKKIKLEFNNIENLIHFRKLDKQKHKHKIPKHK